MAYHLSICKVQSFDVNAPPAEYQAAPSGTRETEACRLKPGIKGNINEFIIENMMKWRHSGLNVYCGKAIWPRNQEDLVNLARYIIRTSF